MLLLHSHLEHQWHLVFAKIMNNMLFWGFILNLYTHTSSLCCMVLFGTCPTSFLLNFRGSPFFFQAWQLNLPTGLQSGILIPTPPCCELASWLRLLKIVGFQQACSPSCFYALLIPFKYWIWCVDHPSKRSKSYYWVLQRSVFFDDIIWPCGPPCICKLHNLQRC